MNFLYFIYSLLELDKNIKDIANQSHELITYNKLKESDISKMESILIQNINRNNQYIFFFI